MTGTLAILGATGDLTARYLLPALARLHADRLLPEQLQILGVGNRDWNDHTFRRHAEDALAGEVVAWTAGDLEQFCGRLRYARADVTDAAALRPALHSALDSAPDSAPGSAHRPVRGPVVTYLALPHTLLPATVTALGAVGLPAGSQLVVEKPFGTGLEDARRLNALVHQVVDEDHVFRVDHFLAKHTVLNLLGLRFANRVFEPVWNALHMERVDIVWDETLALEGRAGYYDAAGALQDMLQNHLLQLLCLVAKEPPTSLHERDLRDRKADVLRAVCPPVPGEVAAATVRARYTAGTVLGRPVPAYVDEAGVDPARGTETFAQVRLHVNNWRWAGVPFVLRSGKALRQDRHEIRLRFRPAPHPAFGPQETPQHNELRLSFDPDRVALAVNFNGLGDPFALDPAQLATGLPPSALPAYAQVLLAALAGDPTLSIRADEAEESWRIMDPILAAWRAGAAPLRNYPAGSSGPAAPPVEPAPARTPETELAW